MLPSAQTAALPSGDIPLFIKGISLFSGFSDELLAVFIHAAKSRNCKKGKVLYLEEDAADFFYAIRSGWVKLFHETLDGDEAVVDVLTTGHIFGETAIFDSDIRACSAQIVEDSELLLIPNALLKEQISRNNTLAMNMLSSMSRHRRRQEKEIEHFSVQNAPQRVGCFLLRICPLGKENNIILHLPYDKTLLASRLGMKPETFSRALNTLRGATGIRISGARIEIDTIGQLTDFSCNACSSSYPCTDL